MASFSTPQPGQFIRDGRAVLAAKLAIADYLAMPLARLSLEDRAYIDSVLAETLERRTIIACVRGYFRQQGRDSAQGDDHAV